VRTAVNACNVAAVLVPTKIFTFDRDVIQQVLSAAATFGPGEHSGRARCRALESLAPDLIGALYEYSESVCSLSFRLRKWRVQENFGPTKGPTNIAPYEFHTDRRRYLKLMVYLSDVSAADGPFEVAVGSWVKRSAHSNRAIKRSSREDGFNLVDITASEAVVGPRGTAIIFDTAQPHRARPMAQGGARSVIRLDFSPTLRAWR
jgi:hypothetical protein